MRKELTKAEYLNRVALPRRRYESLVVQSSRATLRGRVAAPCYWFERNDVAEEDGRYWQERSLAAITLMVDGKPSALFYLAGKRLESCTFAYHLTAAELSKAVVAMRRARLGRLILAAAKWAVREMPKGRRPVLEQALRGLVRELEPRAGGPGGRRRTSA